jgi:type II secretory pathway pseudopilin PulG
MKRLVSLGLLLSGSLVACSKGADTTAMDSLARSQDQVAQSSLRNALVAAKTYFTDAATYSGWTASQGGVIEPSLTWADDQPATVDTVSVDFADGFQTVMSTTSASGTSFCIADDAESGTTYGTVDAQGATAAAGCTGGAWGSGGS